MSKAYLFLLATYVLIGTWMTLTMNPIIVATPGSVPDLVNRKVLAPGQVWSLKQDNPFDEHKTTVWIAAIKDGYVKYYFIHRGGVVGEPQGETVATFSRLFTTLEPPR